MLAILAMVSPSDTAEDCFQRCSPTLEQLGQRVIATGHGEGSSDSVACGTGHLYTLAEGTMVWDGPGISGDHLITQIEKPHWYDTADHTVTTMPTVSHCS